MRLKGREYDQLRKGEVIRSIVQKHGRIAISRPYCKGFIIYYDQNIDWIDREIIPIGHEIRLWPLPTYRYRTFALWLGVRGRKISDYEQISLRLFQKWGDIKIITEQTSINPWKDP